MAWNGLDGWGEAVSDNCHAYLHFWHQFQDWHSATCMASLSQPSWQWTSKNRKLCTSLALLLIELSWLQVSTGVFQCVMTLPLDPTSLLGEQPPDRLEPFEARANPDVEDLLAHRDAVVQDLDETPVLIVPPQPPHRASSHCTHSVGPLVEDQIIYLPSSWNVFPQDDDTRGKT